jgi:DNA/RNA endonuclease G (NUC1)
MRRVFALAAVLVLFTSCVSPDQLAPTFSETGLLSALSLPEVRFSELHYDNAGVDVGEAIEISGPAGADVTNWRIVLYNGNGGAAYRTDTLRTMIPTVCGDRGVLVVNYPSNGIQNGSPDGMALVDAAGTVIEFLSYEGSFTAVGGAANELNSTDIGVAETGSEPIGSSLQRDGAGNWRATVTPPDTNSFRACNDNVPPPPPLPTPLPDTRFSELHYDNTGTDAAEAIEIEGPAATDLTGWRVVLYNGSTGAPYNTRALSGIIPDQCGGRGVQLLTYPQDGIQNGSPDGLALVDPAAAVVEFLSYEGTFTAVGGPADGLVSSDIGVVQTGAPVGQSLQRDATGAWSGSSGQSRGGCNSSGPLPMPGTITFTGRVVSDVPLPVGFEDQLFGTLHDGSGNVVADATFTWSSDTPALATIDQNGVMHALGAGLATFRATAPDGVTTATYVLPMTVATASATASYAGNAEFGEPTDGEPSDDFIVRHPEYTTSYNRNRGEPNWVSYDIDVSHFGPEDRCDCFTFDPALPADFTRYTTADYTGAGAAAGYSIDRGHLARSFDRTSGALDNAFTFYFSNIVPQAADLNQGPWAVLENYLGDRARFDNREIYVMAGGAGNKGTIKNEGKIVIPESMWKVAVILPRDEGLADVHSSRDVEVIAVIMPNVPGIRNENWESYKTTVDAVEALSGYDLLALLPDPIEISVESGIADAARLVDGLVAAHLLGDGDAKWISNKLEIAVKLLGQAQRNAAVNQLQEVVRRTESAGPGAAPLVAALQRLIQSILASETP